MEETSKAVGCMGTVLIVLLLGWVITAIGKCSAPAEQEGFPGPIPVRYQGAYNSYMCGQGADGLVTVGGDDINYGGAKFDVTDLVSESQNFDNASRRADCCQWPRSSPDVHHYLRASRWNGAA